MQKDEKEVPEDENSGSKPSVVEGDEGATPQTAEVHRSIDRYPLKWDPKPEDDDWLYT